MRPRRPLVVSGLLALGLLGAACVPPPPADPPPGPPPGPIAVETWVSGLSIPWDLAFTPDGTMLLTERAGGIKVVRANRTVAALAGGAPADMTASGEGGMMGLAVDPDFATNRRIYACFLSSAPAGDAYDVRVARFTVDGDYTALANRTDIVVGIPANPGQLGRHSGCRLRFGPDGDLWIGTGDATTGTAPQDLTSLGGKVLRVDTDGVGTADHADIADDRIHTYGHRNVQGLAFRPGSGTAYSVEHGTGCDDELNRLTGGANYGWDPVPGYNEATPMTDVDKFPSAVTPVWSSACPTIAPSGATFLSGSQWGDWNGRLAMAVLKAQQLRILQLDAGGGAVVSTVVTLTDRGRLRTPVQGPDGALYVTTGNTAGSAGDQILRVTRS